VAETTDLQRFWRGALDAYVDYWRSVGRLSATYVRALAGAAGLEPSASTPAAAAAPASPRPVQTTMALEGEAGTTAVGMFVVENSGPSPISGELAVPSLTDSEGREVRATIAFEPERVTLEPGEQTVVQAMVKIGRPLRTSVDYRGNVHVPGLAATSIPLVVRRLPMTRRTRTGKSQAKA
jgi:hypothetical protein